MQIIAALSAARGTALSCVARLISYHARISKSKTSRNPTSEPIEMKAKVRGKERKELKEKVWKK
jgi:hypothetical protein